MKSLMIFCFFLVSCFSYGQLFSIASDKNHVLYAGVENPLTITVHKISSKKVIAKTDNGTLTGENGHYNFYTDTGSIANITLYKKGSNKKIGHAIFYMRQLPDPTPHIGSYTSGYISSAYIRSEAGIRTGHASMYYQKGIPVTSFTMSIIRDNDYVFKEIKNEGAMFNEEVKNAFKQLMPGDSLVFNNIFAKRHDGTLTILSSLTFTIKN
jgi:hypothetical protein